MLPTAETILMSMENTRNMAGLTQNDPTRGLSASGRLVPSLQLDAGALQSLVEQWQTAADQTKTPRSRAPVAGQLQEANELAALVEELPSCRLLPPATASDLRQIALAVQALNDRRQELVHDKSNLEEAQQVRTSARTFITLIKSTLCFIEESERDEQLAVKISRIDNAQRSAWGMAMVIEFCLELVETYPDALLNLGITSETIAAGYQLPASLRGLGFQRGKHRTQTKEARKSRDQMLSLLRERVQQTRRALRFVYQGQPQVLARVHSEYLRRKRGHRLGLGAPHPPKSGKLKDLSYKTPSTDPRSVAGLNALE